MSTTMKSLVTTLAFAFGATLTGCKTAQTANDIAEKSSAVHSLTTQSVIDCKDAAAKDTDYVWQLNNALMTCKQKDLATLLKHSITVTLDQRLAEKKTGVFENEISAVFHANGQQAQGGVLAVSPAASGDIAEIVSGLAAQIVSKKVQPVMIATPQLNNARMIDINWYDAKGLSQKALKKNSALLHQKPCK